MSSNEESGKEIKRENYLNHRNTPWLEILWLYSSSRTCKEGIRWVAWYRNKERELPLYLALDHIYTHIYTPAEPCNLLPPTDSFSWEKPKVHKCSGFFSQDENGRMNVCICCGFSQKGTLFSSIPLGSSPHNLRRHCVTHWTLVL